MDTEALGMICRRLDLVAKILVSEQLRQKLITKKGLVTDLSLLGFRAGEIALLSGQTGNAVRIAQSRLRKKGILKGKPNDENQRTDGRGRNTTPT